MGHDGALPVILIVGHDHATLTRGDDLVELQAKTADIAPGAAKFALVAGAICLCTILDDEQIMLACGCHNRVDLSRCAAHVDRHYRFGIGRDLGDHVHGIHEQGFIDFTDNRHRAHRQNRRGRGNPGVSWHNHFVAWPDTQRLQPGDQRRGAGGDGDRIAHALVGGKGIFQRLDFGSTLTRAIVAEKAFAAQHFEDCGLFGLTNRHAAGEHRGIRALFGGCAAVDC